MRIAFFGKSKRHTRTTTYIARALEREGHRLCWVNERKRARLLGRRAAHALTLRQLARFRPELVLIHANDVLPETFEALAGRQPHGPLHAGLLEPAARARDARARPARRPAADGRAGPDSGFPGGGRAPRGVPGRGLRSRGAPSRSRVARAELRLGRRLHRQDRCRLAARRRARGAGREGVPALRHARLRTRLGAAGDHATTPGRVSARVSRDLLRREDRARARLDHGLRRLHLEPHLVHARLRRLPADQPFARARGAGREPPPSGLVPLGRRVPRADRALPGAARASAAGSPRRGAPSRSRTAPTATSRAISLAHVEGKTPAFPPPEPGCA